MSKRLFAIGAQRLFAASGLTIDLECLESNRDHARTTGLVEKVADRARIQLVMAEIKTGGISLSHYLPPRLDNLWVLRKTSPVYDCVVREKMTREDRAFWEPTEYQTEWKKKVKRLFRNLGMLTLKEKTQLKPQARSIVVNERIENIRLASLLNGAAAGWLRYYMEHHATEGLRSVLSGQVADEAAISMEDYRTWMQGYWQIAGAHASKLGHPCPFPSELPHRLIQMLTYKGDAVVDPWSGTGTTIVAAEKLGRVGIGIDVEALYCELANSRLADAKAKLNNTGTGEKNGEETDEVQ